MDAEEVGEEDFYDDDSEDYITWYDYIRWSTAVFIDGNYFSTLMTLITFYALFGEDIRLAAFDKEVDVVFWSINVTAMFLFALELALASWAKPGFIFSFFWWLDLVATLSLIADIPWFVDPISDALTNAEEQEDTSAAGDTATATRAGTRAGRIIRIVRVVRVIRLVRVVRLLKHLLHYREMRAKAEEGHGPVQHVKKANADESSQTGRILSEQITKQTVIGVLVFILVFPFINVNEVYSRIDYHANQVTDVEVAVLAGAPRATLDRMAVRLVTFWNAVYVDVPELDGPPLVDRAARMAELREIEMENVSFPALVGDGLAIGVFDVSVDVRTTALYSIGFTAFIIVMLGVAAYSFNRVANLYCIRPIESIMKMMRDFSANPLDSMKTKGGLGGGQAETGQLMQSITKIGRLLQIGFGEAGAAIIGANLANGGDIDPMVPGRKMVALFGFVVIFSFSDTTEALKEGVMLYVNRIAAIVHACVHEFAGAINKNIGEAFLMVWPLNHRTEKRTKAVRMRRESYQPVGSLPSSPPISPLKRRAPTNMSLSPDRRGSGGRPPSPDRRASGRPGSPDRRGSGNDKWAPGPQQPMSFKEAQMLAQQQQHMPSLAEATTPAEQPPTIAEEAGPSVTDLSEPDKGTVGAGKAGEPKAMERAAYKSASGFHRARDTHTDGDAAPQPLGDIDAPGMPRPARENSSMSNFRVTTDTSAEGYTRARPGSPGADGKPHLDKRGSTGVDRRGSGSPDRRGSGSRDRRGSGSRDRRGSGSPDRRGSGRGYLSPDRRGSGGSLFAGESPPGTPARVGYAVQENVALPRSPVHHRSTVDFTEMTEEETERYYVLPQGMAEFTTADCAVAGFALCVLLVKANKQLEQLVQNEELQKIHPGFTVETGYGLHMGWAIEGAIGSEYKVDASYLSPNVNLASRLEAATKQYHVRILISEQVYSIMSPPCQKCMRKIDCVTVKGSAHPIVLYTLDVAETEENMRAAEKLDPAVPSQSRRGSKDKDERKGSTDAGTAAVAASAPPAEIKRRNSLGQLMRRFSNGKTAEGALKTLQQSLELDEDEEVEEDVEDADKEALAEKDQEKATFKRTEAIFKLKRTTTPQFLAVFDEARDKYLAGHWEEAHGLFAKCKEILPDDGPTETLMSYIARRDKKAPPGWRGVRELTSK